jgi:hypothetical protein
MANAAAFVVGMWAGAALTVVAVALVYWGGDDDE